MSVLNRSRGALFLSASMVFTMGLSACGKNSQSLDALNSGDIVKTVKAFDYKGESYAETAEQALDMLGLWETDTITWDSRDGSAGDYVYTGVKLPNGRIDTLTLKDVHMRGPLGPFVSTMEIEGLEYLDADGTRRTRLDKGQVNFTTELHNHVNNKIRFVGVEDLFNDLMTLEMGPLFTGSGYFDGLSAMVGDRVEMTTDFVGWHPGLEKDEVSFLAKNIKAFSTPDTTSIDNSGPPPLDMKAGLISLKNFELGTVDFELGFNLNAFNPFDSDYDSIRLKDVVLKFDTADVSLPEMTAGVKGNIKGKYQSVLDMPSLSLSFSGEPATPSLAPAHAFYQRSGFEKLEIRARSKTDLDVKNDRADVDYMTVEVIDGGTLSLDYDVSGIHHYHTARDAYVKQIQEARMRGSVTDLPDSSTVMDDAMQKLSINAMTVVLDDEALLDNVLAQMAEQQDVKIDVTRQQLKGFAMLTTLWFTDPFLSDLSEDFAESAQAFVVKGGGMKFSVAPEAGFELGPALRQAAAEPKKAKEILAPLGADFEHIPD